MQMVPSRSLRALAMAAGVVALLWPVKASPQEQLGADPAARAKVLEAYGKLPLRFEANHGQTDPQVLFLARGLGYGLFLTSTDAVLSLSQPSPEEVPGPPPTVLRMELVGANQAPEVAGLEELAGGTNYFIGRDPSGWRTGIPGYARVEWRDVYPGVSLAYYGNQDQLEYEFVIAPGADPGAIQLNFHGADRVEIDGGDLVLRTAAGEIRQSPPYVYPEIDGFRRQVSGGYVLQGDHRVGFELAAYDASRPLVIDPVLAYSTFLGGSGRDFLEGLAVDAAGNAYVTGETSSTNFPLKNAYQGTPPAGTNAFVTKLDPSGAALVYSTYLGGSGTDRGRGVAVDGAGNAYASGFTNSSNFPVQSAFQPTRSGSYDGYVTKLAASGSALVFSTYLGGSGFDRCDGIAVDADGRVSVTGFTESANFPTLNAIQGAFAGGRDAFVTKFEAAGSPLVYSTYLGGSGNDLGYGMATGGAGDAFVTGETSSSNFPTASALFPVFSGVLDVFVARITAVGSGLVYSTYLGGSDVDAGRGVAVDASGNAYLTGQTSSTNFPVANAFQPVKSGVSDVYVTKLDPTGSALVYSTFLGGGADDGGDAVAVDGSGQAHVTGVTNSTDFPRLLAFQEIYGGGQDAFVTRFNATGSDVTLSSYLGGIRNEIGAGIGVDGGGNVYVAGPTAGSFPTANAFQSAYGGGSFDGFVAKVADGPLPVIVAVADFSFTPQTSTVAQGNSVQWNFNGPSDHTATDRSGMGLFDSGIMPPTTSYSFTFAGAGGYPYNCTLHPTQMTGTVQVPMQVAPASGGTGTTFTITWASAPPAAGYVFDIQIKRPGSPSFVNWMTNQTVTGASFVPDAGPGTYSFRTRLRNTGLAKASQFSPTSSISVM